MMSKVIAELVPSTAALSSDENADDVFLYEGQALAVFGGSGAGIGGIIRQLIDHALARETANEPYSVKFHFDRMRPGALGILFDDASWSFCNLFVDEEIAFVLENSGVPPAEMPAIVDRALQSVGLAGFERRKISTLSGGELRRIALAAILVGRPNLIISDDLNGHLDLAALDKLEAVLKDYVESNRACWVDFRRRWSQFALPDEAFATLKNGKLTSGHKRLISQVESGAGEPFGIELANHFSSLLRDETPIFSSPQAAVDWLSSQRAKLVSIAAVRAAGDSLLSARGLCFGYDKSTMLLTGLNLELRAGRVYALGGKNGSGKSTLARLLCGLRRPQHGDVGIHGRRVSAAVLKRSSALVFQKPEYQFVTDSVEDELALALADRQTSPTGQNLTAIAETFSLTSLLARHPFSLGIGEKRRLSVACAIASARNLLIVDEPTLGQDEVQTRLLGAQLQAAADTNCSVLVITHDPEFIAGYCDQVLWLEGGTILPLGSPEEAFSSNSHSMFAGKSHLLRFWELAVNAGLATGQTPRVLEHLRLSRP